MIWSVWWRKRSRKDKTPRYTPTDKAHAFENLGDYFSLCGRRKPADRTMSVTEEQPIMNETVTFRDAPDRLFLVPKCRICYKRSTLRVNKELTEITKNYTNTEFVADKVL